MVESRHLLTKMVTGIMSWFETFASKGLYLPAFTIAFGSLVVLRAPSTRTLSENEILAGPAWIRWLARRNSERLQRSCGWTIIGFAVFTAIIRIAWDR